MKFLVMFLSLFSWEHSRVDYAYHSTLTVACDGAVEEYWLGVVDCDGVDLGLEDALVTWTLELESHIV